MNILRDPIWQFIGAILGFLAIGISVYLYLLQKNKKSLSYKIETETALLTVNDELRGKLQILYEGAPIQDVYLLILEVTSDGNVPIASTDYDVPLSFSFGEEARILSAEVIKTLPKTLKPILRFEANKITLEPMLLNSQDTLTIKTLISQFKGEVSPEGRIVGVKDIKNVSARGYTFREVMVIFLLYLIGGNVVLLILSRFTYTRADIVFLVSISIAATVWHWLIKRKEVESKL